MQYVEALFAIVILILIFAFKVWLILLFFDWAGAWGLGLVAFGLFLAGVIWIADKYGSRPV